MKYCIGGDAIYVTFAAACSAVEAATSYAYPMPVRKLAHTVGTAVVARTAQGGNQNFLGAPWVEYAVNSSPMWARERIALRLLSLSPHYFYSSDIRAEAERNRRSRQSLANSLIAPHVNKNASVLDYGCGPGYMAVAVAERTRYVHAVDISRGVLACAKVLNQRSNITYCRPDQLDKLSEMVDLVYSFAVVQHLRTQALVGVLGLLADKLRPGGTLLLHFAVPVEGGWRTEDDWMADRSFAGRAKLRYGLNCFGRSVAEMEALVAGNGFEDVVTGQIDGETAWMEDDDISEQHWLTARRK